LNEIHFICKEDQVYMDNEEWLNEYIMADTGLIWRGSHNRMRPCYWNFAQFEKDILECCVYLISKVSKLSIAGRADPVRVARAISAVVSFRLFLFKKKKSFVSILTPFIWLFLSVALNG